jgi:hypothetical protein
MTSPSADSYARLGTYNMVLPPEGARVYPFTLDFRSDGLAQLNFLLQIQQQQVSFIQGIFVDNSLNLNPLFIRTDQVNQVVQIPKQTQGYMPLFVSDSAVLDFTTVQAGNLLVPIVVTNVPVMPYLWSTA